MNPWIVVGIVVALAVGAWFVSTRRTALGASDPAPEPRRRRKRRRSGWSKLGSAIGGFAAGVVSGGLK